MCIILNKYYRFKLMKRFFCKKSKKINVQSSENNSPSSYETTINENTPSETIISENNILPPSYETALNQHNNLPPSYEMTLSNNLKNDKVSKNTIVGSEIELTHSSYTLQTDFVKLIKNGKNKGKIKMNIELLKLHNEYIKIFDYKVDINDSIDKQKRIDEINDEIGYEKSDIIEIINNDNIYVKYREIFETLFNEIKEQLNSDYINIDLIYKIKRIILKQKYSFLNNIFFTDITFSNLHINIEDVYNFYLTLKNNVTENIELQKYLIENNILYCNINLFYKINMYLYLKENIPRYYSYIQNKYLEENEKKLEKYYKVDDKIVTLRVYIEMIKTANKNIKDMKRFYLDSYIENLNRNKTIINDKNIIDAYNYNNYICKLIEERDILKYGKTPEKRPIKKKYNRWFNLGATSSDVNHLILSNYVMMNIISGN